ncbi:MAG: malto-oligosyltrehalose trehalohydrolase [Betaproteobacteria bacterium]|nr:malto-oligosyltrehalose trehalohydrolase [Betaproteobacteria bacterium]
MRRVHSMPFGAEVHADGLTRFRLWAPTARTVELCLRGEGEERVMPVESAGKGWFERVTDRAPPGTLYVYRIDGALRVPDPASRFQPEDVHGPSRVVDPGAFDWADGDWRGRPWEEAVIYELHVGTFVPEGTFAGVERRLDYLNELGVTALELMPIADYPGTRNWGYDGVLPFAPDSRYGAPQDLKALVQAAHARGLMVFLDVVYNHFGPEGNYLHAYAPRFFSTRHETPWGPAINFDGPGSRNVRDFFIHNALYWLEEFHFDGLRLDAVHAIADDSTPDILTELADAVHRGPGRERLIHLVLENDRNESRYLAQQSPSKPRWYAAQWNDDIHHALHVIVTGETDGYYHDFAERPLWYLGRCLAEGFAFQGEPSPYRGQRLRGEPSRDLPPSAFVSFLQTHDQVGNRAFGERLVGLAAPEALRAAVSILLLSPAPPLLFMGEEFGSARPFLFFCDFGGELALAVREGRRREFERFRRFADPAAREAIPDPCDPATFRDSCLDWENLTKAPHCDWLALYRDLLEVRRRSVAPRLAGMEGGRARFETLGATGLSARWTLGDGSGLRVMANLGAGFLPDIPEPGGELLHAVGAGLPESLAQWVMPPWSVAWFLEGRQG